MSAIGSKIRNLRLRLGLSQRQLAGKEMTRAFISLVESGRATLSQRTLRIIAQRLGKPLEYFLAEERSTDGVDLGGMIFKEAQRKVQAGEIQPALQMLYQVFKETRNQYLRAAAHDLLSICLTHLGRFAEALSECKEALEIFRAVKDRTGIVQEYLRLGALAFALEDFPEARKAYEEAVQCTLGQKRLQDLHIEALTNLGATLVYLGELQEAIRVYQDAVRACSIQGDLPRLGRIATGLGMALLHSDQVEAALEWAQRAVDLLDKDQGPDKIHALHVIGRTLAARGDYDEAYRIYQVCFAAYKDKNLIGAQASLLEDLSWYWLQRGELPKAKRLCREALDLLDTQDDGILRGRLYRVLGIIAREDGDTERAYFLLRMSYDLARRLNASKEAVQSFEALQELKAGRSPKFP